MLLIPLLIGSLALVVNMLIQIVVIVALTGYLLRLPDSGRLLPTIGTDIKLMSVIFLVLFGGHVLQFAIWASLFLWLGEFSDFATAFYHSVVNFTSLGYGDIVMSEKWRLLGPIETANGILMFGLTTSAFIAVMTRLFGRNSKIVRARTKLAESGDAG
jgi:hypothetical protein